MMKRRIFLWMGLIVLFFVVGFYQEGYSQELYKVKHGDTLQKVSKKFGVNQEEIKTLNKLRRNSIRPHQTLLIPSKEQNGDGYGQASLPSYVVKRGDNLYTISKKTGASIDAIKEINRLRNNRLRIGQVLALSKPESLDNTDEHSANLSEKITEETLIQTNANAEFVMDNKEKGNTPIISIMSGETVPAENSVSFANTALQSNIPANEQIPKAEVPPSDNKITINDAAPIQKDSANNLVALDSSNGEITNKITEKDKKKPLIDQNPRGKSITKNSNKPFASLKSPSSRSYVVKKGDTIHKISRKVHVSVASIRKINHLRSKSLKVGQVLVLSNSPISNVIPENAASVTTPNNNDEEEADSGEAPTEEYNKTDMDREIETSSDIMGKWNNPDERNLLVKVVMGFLGTPYKWGGSSIRGLDCSAFVRKMYSFFDIELPRTAREQSHVGKRIARSDLEIGDLIFFNTRRPIGHVGIYVGNNEFIHASYRGKQVKIDTLATPYYDTRFTKAVRLKGLDEKK